MRCVICGGSESKAVFEAGVAQPKRVLQCLGCGLMYVDLEDPHKVHVPIPVYGGRYWNSAEFWEGHVAKQVRQLEDYRKIFDALETRLPKGARILEVGCNIGVFMNWMEAQGYKVTGVEPEEHLVKYAQEHYRLNIIQSYLRDAPLEPGSFDVVLLLHVIEHMADPVGELDCMLRLMKENGILVVETPMYDSLVFRLLRHRERSISTPTHVFFYTRKTLRQLLEQRGFKVIRVDRVGRTLSAWCSILPSSRQARTLQGGCGAWSSIRDSGVFGSGSMSATCSGFMPSRGTEAYGKCAGQPDAAGDNRRQPRMALRLRRCFGCSSIITGHRSKRRPWR